MKCSIFVLSVSFALLFLPLVASAEEISFIEVRGTATERAAVDKITWTIRIRSVDPELASAAKSIEECYQKLKLDIEALQIPSLQLRAAQVSSGREYEQKSNGKFLGFFVSRGLTVTVTDLARVNDIQKRLLSDDRIAINDVNRGSTKELELKARSLEKAAEAAREKADRLAQTLKFKIGRVLVVVDGGVSLSGGGSMQMLTANVINQPIFGDANGAELDEVSVTQTVTIKYAIVE